MNDIFSNKIKIALRSCQFHVVGVISYALLEEIAPNIYSLQSKGIFVEFIILMENAKKSIKATNTLMRISAAGGELYCAEEAEHDVAYFVHIDKRIALNSKGDDYHIDTDIQIHLRGDENIYQQIKEKAKRLVHQSGSPKIIGYASHEWVKKGEYTKIFWETDKAQSVILYPQKIDLPLKGSMELQINNDSLFSIQAKNDNMITEKRIFIKVLSPLGITFSVFIATDYSQELIPLHAHPDIPFHFAIPPACNLRLYWEAEQTGILNENTWGEIPSNGFRDMQCNENTMLHFKWKTIFDVKNIDLHFYILDESKQEKTAKMEKATQSIFRFFQRRTLLF
ncbi:MAG: hypothetical protein ACK5ZX_08500 [Bacteroidota bacterium]